MNQLPAPSRPAPPDVQPVEFDGVRYVQDRFDDRQGDQAGGYLAAYDIASGARLWRLQVYPVADHRAAGVGGGALLFRAMRLSDDRRTLEIENEAGGVYRVDLSSRAVTQVAGPPERATTGIDAGKPGPKPKPAP